MRPSSILFTLISSLLTSTLATTPSPLTLRVPAHIPPLPYTTRAILTTTNHTHKAPITRSNTFVFPDIHTSTQSNPNQKKLSYLLDIACRDYDFMSYGVDVGRGGKVEIYRVGRGGIEMGGREVVGEEGVEVRVLRIREYYEERAGCEFVPETMKESKSDIWIHWLTGDAM